MEQQFQEEPIQLSLFDSDLVGLSLWKVESPPTISKITSSFSRAEPSLGTIRIKDLPPSERPRDRLLEHGAKHLATSELLAILLGTGQGTEHLSAIGLSQRILRVLSLTEREPLRKLRHVTVEELMDISGVGLAKACVIIAAIELGKRAFSQQPATFTVIDDPSVAASILSQDLMWEQQEQFAVLFLDIKHHFLSKKIISVGTQTETLAHPREIFREALQHRAVRILVAHNHPSGSLKPSPEDLDLTRQLLKSAQILGIPLLDHLILSEGRYVSLRQTTTLWNEFTQD